MARQQRRKRKELTGKFARLSRPIVIPPPPRLSTGTFLHTNNQDKEIRAKYEQWKMRCALIAAGESLKKLDLLFDLYGIERGKQTSWFQLALRLAIDYIPGFSIAKRPGRHKKWDEWHLFKLNREINRIKKEKDGRSAQHACRSLSRRQNEYNLTPRRLYHLYSESKASAFVIFFEWMSSNPNFSPDKINSFMDVLISGIEKRRP